MTAATAASPAIVQAVGLERFRLNRAGILNVWQYDEQVFHFAGGRLLLRGANGAGKSKTLEMLLPFALDGDKARITASAKHHTSLLWLMTDGLDGGNRIGYVWVEFLRHTEHGAEETYTCGVGIRASASARSATAWHFATDRRIGTDLSLEDDAGPLSMPRLKEVLGAEHVFERAADYKAHVGRTLFGLDAAQYDEVLRLLYWLRQPQVGEDIEPSKLAQQLSQALPQLDEQAIRAAGDTFDELTAFGEQIERRTAAAAELAHVADAYGDYARAVVAQRARAVAEALGNERRLRSELRTARATVEQVQTDYELAQSARAEARTAIDAATASLRTLEDSPEFRNQRRLSELDEKAREDATRANEADRRSDAKRSAVTRWEAMSAQRARKSEQQLHAYVDRLRDLDRRQRGAVPGSRVIPPALLGEALLKQVDQLPGIIDALDRSLASIREARSAVTRRVAGVALVREALQAVERAASEQRVAERNADQAEQRWDQARASRVRAEEQVDHEIAMLTTALQAWTATPGSPVFELPDELTATFLATLPRAARSAAAPTLRALRQDHARTTARRDAAQQETDRLAAERATVASEQDPAPPEPSLPRTDRSDGTALWQVVDFRAGLPDEARSGVEAALQASGLLDAWIRPGGKLLDAEHLDIALAGVGEEAADGGLNSMLEPDVPAGCDVTAADVCRVLAAIQTGDQPEGPAVIRVDGTWRLGPAHGRSAKDRPQYIGATARANERLRRLEAIDAEIARHAEQIDQARRLLEELDAAVQGLESWAESPPSGAELSTAWVRLEERSAAEEREEQDNRRAQQVAHAAREVTARTRTRLSQVALEQELPADGGGLDALDEALRGLAEDHRDVPGADRAIRDRLGHWEEAVGELSAANEELASAAEEAAEAARRANVSHAEYDSLRASVGESVEALQQRIAEVKRAHRVHEEAERTAAKRAEGLMQDKGRADEAARNAEQLLAEHLAVRDGELGSLAAVATVPGLLDAAAGDPDALDIIPGLASHPASEPVGRAVTAAIERLAALSREEASSAATRLWRAYNEATSGAAADHQPTIGEFGDLLAVSGRDEAGETTIVALANRVRAGVDHDRDLLSEREKRQFEQHILGELGDAIRQCRRDAEELVAAMNDQLGHVTTSQGIRVTLDWKLRDDVPPEARAAVALLVQPVGALVPEERASLRDALQRLIEASRGERPELAYGEHLAAALDYRTWSGFTIRYTRPETPGSWERLHRRSPLSQGEQKVLCYLPLFAAAAAHFTSLAGAAPHAPRLVLLDDAFPKIDVRTHPLLFGLLVQLDLDFVITSERLWGDHSTVPSLAIYEALRDPSQRGIAQYKYHWDGRALQGVG